MGARVPPRRPCSDQEAPVFVLAIKRTQAPKAPHSSIPTRRDRSGCSSGLTTLKQPETGQLLAFCGNLEDSRRRRVPAESRGLQVELRDAERAQ
jgi:hypothetical protein